MDVDKIKKSANNIVTLSQHINTYKTSKKLFLEKITKLNDDYAVKKISKAQFDEWILNLLKGKTRQQEIDLYDAKILSFITQIENELKVIKSQIKLSQGSELLAKFLGSDQYEHMDKKLKKQYLQDLNIAPELVSRFLQRKKAGEKIIIEKDYEAYEPHFYGKLSNKYVRPVTGYLLKTYPDLFKKLFDSLQASGFKVVSKTYVSMLIFSSIVVTIVMTLLISIFFSDPSIILQLIRGILLGLVSGVVTAAMLFFYPSSVVNSKRSSMKAELPFMLIHMSAVAGSGAKPISIFQTVLTTNDYPLLGIQVKKIVNYVNVFGYDLSTSLKLVAMTSPSPEFKDVLMGMVNTITSGGDMKEYLTSISQDSLTTYQMERKKAVEMISTYSDIYTAILIAAPLLFFVTIAIIQMLGGKIAGMSAGVIATIGTYGVIPLLNVGYIIFISAVQPK